jgi:transposase
MVSACCSYMQRAIMKHRPAAAAAAGSGAAATTSSSTGIAVEGQQQQQQEAGLALPPMLLAAAAAQPEGFADDVQQLRLKRLLGVIRCLTCTGEYVEALAPYLTHQGVECCCVLLQAWKGDGVLLNEVLQMVCSLLAHRRFGELLVELGGVQLLLACPRWVTGTSYFDRLFPTLTNVDHELLLGESGQRALGLIGQLLLELGGVQLLLACPRWVSGNCQFDHV